MGLQLQHIFARKRVRPLKKQGQHMVNGRAGFVLNGQVMRVAWLEGLSAQ
jgi:hypothetical protein